MPYEDFLKLDNPVFSHSDVAHAFGIKLVSAEVLCSRYVKKGLLTRIKRGLYARTETLSHLDRRELFRMANILQVPSYISLATALSYYGMVSQARAGFFESISLKRTRTFEAGGFSFVYTKIKPDLYREFIKRDGVFIALPEKAVLDCCYLASMGRYSLDGAPLDVTRLDEKSLAECSALYPLKTRKYLEAFYAKLTRRKSL